MMMRLHCCSNHSSLKDKWSHNKQSSPVGYQVTNGGITRELDKEPLLHCSSIYITYKWSVLQQYLTDPKVHAASSCPLLIFPTSTLRPPCFLHVPWCHTFNLRYTCAHYVYTMRNLYPLTSSPNPNSISRLFPILLDFKSFQTILDSITWLPGHVPISYPFVRCRLIINYFPNPNPSPKSVHTLVL